MEKARALTINFNGIFFYCLVQCEQQWRLQHPSKSFGDGNNPLKRNQDWNAATLNTHLSFGIGEWLWMIMPQGASNSLANQN